MATRRTMQVSQRRQVQTVPRLGTEAEMQAEAVQQIRARVNFQKELVAAHKHGHEEEVAEMWRWVHLSFKVGLPICVLSALYTLVFDEHHHRKENVPEFMNIRSKEFPWECGDCPLFDLECWKKCRAEKA